MYRSIASAITQYLSYYFH